MITDKNMQKLLKIVFGMNHRIILFESTEKKLVCLQIDCKHLQCTHRCSKFNSSCFRQLSNYKIVLNLALQPVPSKRRKNMTEKSFSPMPTTKYS